MGKLKYAVHAFAWTTNWSNETLGLIDRAADYGFDLLEIPVTEIDLIDPMKIKERLGRVGIGVCTSVACSDATDITADDEETRKRGIEYLERCLRATAAMGGTCLTGITYSAIARRIAAIPDERYWERSANALRVVARLGQELGVTVGIEAVNRYETFLINTCDQALKLRDMIGEPNVGIHLDTYHMNMEENDFYEQQKGPCLISATIT